MQSVLSQLPQIIADSRELVAALLDRSKLQPFQHQLGDWMMPSNSADSGAYSYAAAGGNSAADMQPDSQLILHGDNLLHMAALLQEDAARPSLRGKIQLIYIDPPYNSQSDYASTIKLPAGDAHAKTHQIKQLAYTDQWSEGIVSYLRMLTPRLLLMKELLHARGALYVHIDWHVGHYVKIILDEIMGMEQFRNEIVWQRDAVGKGAKKSSSQWSRELESIFVYSRSADMKFNQPYKHAEQLTHTQLKEFRYQEEDGRKFKIVTLGDYSQQTIERLRQQKLIYTTRQGTEYRKYYLDEFKLAIGSLWNDIPNLSHGRNTERLPFDTQKPERLLERVLLAGSDPGDLVADFFAGSGTLAAVAERLGRKWICADINYQAVHLTRKRLLADQQRPFAIAALKDYTRLGLLVKQPDGKQEKLCEAVFRLFDAEQREYRQPFYIGWSAKSKTLVLLLAVEHCCTQQTVDEAMRLLEQYDCTMLALLCWQVEAELGQALYRSADDRLQVLKIQDELLDQWKWKASRIKLARRKHRFFTTLPYLQVGLNCTIEAQHHVQLELQLEKYDYVSREALPLEARSKPRLLEQLERDSLSLLDYWSVEVYDEQQRLLYQWHSLDQQLVHSVQLHAETSLFIVVKAVDLLGLTSRWSCKWRPEYSESI